MMPNVVLAPISVGELIDKITILKLKQVRISDPEKVELVSNELRQLNRIRSELHLPSIESLESELYNVNALLWDIEEAKRQCEKTKMFNQLFVELARSVYLKNDERAHLKKLINERCFSEIVEVKSY